MTQLSIFDNLTTPPQAASLHTDLMSERIPFDAVETLLEGFLEKELAEFEPVSVKAVPETSFSAKFKHSSSMQKCIRRGAVCDAVISALSYHQLDSTGFWNRIQIVAFEDLGVADVWTVAMTLAAARSTIWRKRAGGDERIIQFLIKRMAEAAKDRTVADLCQVLENRSLSPEALTLLKSATPQELSTIALSNRPYEARIAALWLLWGGRMPNPRLPLGEGSREWFDYTLKQMPIPGLVRYICQRGMVALRGCAMNVTYPFVWLMMMLSNSVTLIATELPERYYIGGVPEEAWDKHTILGKKSYQLFYRSCPALNEFLTSKGIVGNDEIIRAIGISMFINESAILGKRIDFEGAEQVYMMTVEDDYKKNGLSLTDGMELSRLIQENYTILRRSRQVVIEGKSR